MKVILNKDLTPLGEEGDVKEVARGYARNFLFPGGFAFPYDEKSVKLFEGRRESIEKRKADKRTDAAGIKEKLEALELTITMPAGPNGKLYGAVTSQTIMDELSKNGYQTERKRIELAGNNFKTVGKYKATVKLYENASAEITIIVTGQEIKTESKAPAAPARGRRRRESTDSAENTSERSVVSEGVVASEGVVVAEGVSEGASEGASPGESVTEEPVKQELTE